MLTLNDLIQHALIHGAILSAALTALILASLMYNPEIFYRSFPAEVKERYGPISEKGQRDRLVVLPIFLAILLGILAWSMIALARLVAGPVSFGTAWIVAYMMLFLFNAVDAFIIDAGLMILRPRFAFLPGTEDMAGYSDWNKWLVDFLKGLLITAVVALIPALLTWLATRPW